MFIHVKTQLEIYNCIELLILIHIELDVCNLGKESEAWVTEVLALPLIRMVHDSFYVL